MKTRRETQLAAHWSGAPSLIHRWMEALLRLAATYLVNLARLVRFKHSLPTGECDACADGSVETDTPSDPTTKEPKQAARHSSRTTPALTLVRSGPRSGRSSRQIHLERVEGSNHEGGFTAARDKPVETRQSCLALPPLIPANAGTQGGRQGLSRLQAAAAIQNKARLGSWMPTFVGTSGETAPI